MSFGIPGIALPSTQYSGVPLSAANEEHIRVLSSQGNTSLTYAELMEQQSAQAEMLKASTEQNIEVPKVNFYPSRHSNPSKARRQDIKQAYRLLRPAKRSILDPRRWWGGKHRHNKDTGVCIVEGCDVKKLIQFDNLYMRITDEETGRSLWEMYWTNPVSGEAEAFIAREGVTSGRKMRGTYCPEHLHLYHLLNKWETEEEKERLSNPKSIRERVRQGVSTVAIPISSVKKKDNTPPMLQKYADFFTELEKDSKNTDGIDILRYKNKITGFNDVTMIVFDYRIFQHELEAMEQQAQDAFNVMLQQQPTTVQPQATMIAQQVNEPVPIQEA